jgi:hypothetical protein
MPRWGDLGFIPASRFLIVSRSSRSQSSARPRQRPPSAQLLGHRYLARRPAARRQHATVSLDLLRYAVLQHRLLAVPRYGRLGVRRAGK